MRRTISEILQVNGFYKKWNTYDRDDWIQVWNWKDKYVVNSVWDVFNWKNELELIWFLAFVGIINKLQ